MVFPQVDNVPRHPSQLYEFGLEGLLLFVILWIVLVAAAPARRGVGLFLIGYGSSASSPNSRASPTASSASLRAA